MKISQNKLNSRFKIQTFKIRTANPIGKLYKKTYKRESSFLALWCLFGKFSNNQFCTSIIFDAII
jgi:hypothetical protein